MGLMRSLTGLWRSRMFGVGGLDEGGVVLGESDSRGGDF